MPFSSIALVVAATAISAGELSSPRAQGRWVLDRAGVIPEGSELAIDRLCQALDRDLGVEVAVVTVPDVDDTPKSFATALFDRWGIGKRHADNGLLVLLVRDKRRLEMETGYGLEPVLPDGWLGTMQQDVIVPRFRTGDFGGGLVAGLEAVAGRLRARPEDAREGTRRLDARAPVLGVDGAAPSRSLSPAVGGAAGAMALGAAAIGAVLGLRAYRRRRTCPQCKVPMYLVGEVADDEHLEETQRLEESLGSMDYEVRICPNCQFTRTMPHTKWFSGYSRCGQCQARTLKTTSTTLVAATYDHGGRVRVQEVCKHCNFQKEYVRYTARLTRSSGSSYGGGRSSGGSFGGGRSGGGGAGSSW